jgi:CopG family nickel-responsive transcriptional regulator
MSISMPEAFLERIDTFADEHGYSGRSEVVREASRKLLEEFQHGDTNSSTLSCTVTAVFDYGESAAVALLTGIRHENDGIVSGTTHAHLSDKYCIELFVLRGTVEEIAGFVNTVRAIPNVRTVEYSILPLGAEISKKAVQ